MKKVQLIIIGLVFGFILTKAEVISWYRIFEMFRFESFHMYGVIGGAVVVSLFFNQLIKRSKMNDIDGNPIVIPTFYKGFTQYLVGGIFFGLGWALTGACPAPLYTLVGTGVTVFIAAIASALLGALVYGLVRKYLPH
jgi:uncharacterized membrane protein YedE/YeeE